MKIILGSASRWRQALLREMGYDFEVMTADIDEKAIRTENYRDLPIVLARAKAEEILRNINEPALLITLDEIAAFDGKIVEKPDDAGEARRTLKSYANSAVETITSVVVTNTASGKSAEGTDICQVHFREIPDDVIEGLIQRGSILKCAGSFEIMDPVIQKYVERIDGTVDSVAGLPKELVKNLLEKVKI